MGDRGNIVIRSSQNSIDDVWFYTHWSGSDIEQTARKALSKKWRWGDSSYLARIVFDELTAGQQGEETGFGISTKLQDNEHPILIIDDDKQQVYIISEAKLIEGRIPEDYKPPFTSSYEQFIQAGSKLKGKQ